MWLFLPVDPPLRPFCFFLTDTLPSSSLMSSGVKRTITLVTSRSFFQEVEKTYTYNDYVGQEVAKKGEIVLMSD